MGARAVILGAALLFIALLGSLTVYDAATSGLNALTLVSLLVLGLLASGIVGALLAPPEDED